MSEQVVLRIDGAVEAPRSLRYEDLAALPSDVQVADVSQFHPKRKGDGVTLESVLALVTPRSDADYLTLHADRDDFHASIPLDAVRSEGLVVYKLGGGPLSLDQGGPFRFLIRDPAACHTAELDDCANVKFLSRIELTVGRGQDTRPTDEAEHEALHEAQGG